MSSYLFDNAIAYAQFRVRGGLKNILIVGGTYAAIIGFLIALTYGTNTRPGDRTGVMEAWTGGLIGLQCLFMMILAPLRVRGAISRDVASQLIESHRTMPLMPRHAIIGYLLGSMSQFLALWLLTMLMGCFTSTMGSMRIEEWLVANIVILVFSIFIASINALTSFVARYFFWLLAGGMLVFIFSRGIPFVWVPALLLLATPWLGLFSAFAHGSMQQEAAVALYLGIGAQVAIIFICIRAAARKYEQSNSVALPFAYTLPLLAIWVGLSIYGTMHLGGIYSGRYDYDGIEGTSIAVGAMATSILFATSVMASLAYTQLSDQQQGKPPRSRRLTLIAALTLATAIVTTMPSFIIRHPRIDNHLAVAGITILCLLQAYALMRIFYGWLRAANILIALIFGLIWLAPVIADLIYSQVTNQNYTSPEYNHFATVSPLGFLMQLNQESHPILIPGLIANAILALGFLLLLQLRQKHLTAKARTQKAKITLPPIPVPIVPPLEIPPQPETGPVA